MSTFDRRRFEAQVGFLFGFVKLFVGRNHSTVSYYNSSILRWLSTFEVFVCFEICPLPSFVVGGGLVVGLECFSMNQSVFVSVIFVFDSRPFSLSS